MSEASLVSLALDGRIATISLDRPAALNAISGAMADELAAAFKDVANRDDVWAVVLTAAGDRAFCVGADLKERGGFSLDDYYDNRRQVRGMFAALRAVPQPTIASVFGFALGGGFELVLSCDLVVASEGTIMGLPEARVGLLPAGGGTQLLTRKVGEGAAKEAIFTGARLPVETWAEMGLRARIVAGQERSAETRRLAEEILRCSPVAVREAKRAIGRAVGIPLDDGISIEDDAWARVIVSDDRAEGIAAFNEKRDPSWSNK